MPRKALKSKVAKDLLGDPKARVQLREYLVGKRSGDVQQQGFKIVIHGADGKIVEVTPKVVPKAA
jgi:hypothetical protein